MRYSRHHASTPRPAVQDGVNPSDAIAKTHSRKVGAFYWSIMEFGPMALGLEQSWLSICSLRQTLWADADGQVTQVAHECAQWFFSRTGTDTREIGMELQLKTGRAIRIFLQLAVIAGDEPGIKEVLANKGHAGAKPCVVCQNCVLHTHPMATKGHGLHEHDDWICSIAETDVSKFVSATQIAWLRARGARRP